MCSLGTPVLAYGFQPPVPLQVLGEAKGRLYTMEELSQLFSRAVFPRTTNPYGCVTLHSYHFYLEAVCLRPGSSCGSMASNYARS